MLKNKLTYAVFNEYSSTLVLIVRQLTEMKLQRYCCALSVCPEH